MVRDPVLASSVEMYRISVRQWVLTRRLPMTGGTTKVCSVEVEIQGEAIRVRVGGEQYPGEAGRLPPPPAGPGR
jgi:hypothetical protein